MKTIIRDATLVNEGKILVNDVLLCDERIEKIQSNITLPIQSASNEIIAQGLHPLPDVIDDQVHFKEHGITQNGMIFSESKAAVAGGITSFMDMPNTTVNF